MSIIFIELDSLICLEQYEKPVNGTPGNPILKSQGKIRLNPLKCSCGTRKKMQSATRCV